MVRSDDDTGERAERIRHRARRLWEEHGRPAGGEEAFRELASELVAIEDSQMAASRPNPAASGEDIAGEPVEPIENQGEFPTLTDQGEEQPAPHRRAAGSARRRLEP